MRHIPHELRCRNCGRLLARVVLPPGGYIEIRCTRSSCHRVTVERGSLLEMASVIKVLNGETPPEVWQAMRDALLVNGNT